jgi:hypothetical protein
MRIKPGYGYWTIDTYPIFRRAGEAGVEIVGDLVAVQPNCHACPNGCDTIGTTDTGRRVAFHSSHTDAGHAA